MALLPVGFAVPACCQARGALLPHHFTLATHSGEPFGGIFLLHFPSARAAQALPGTVPCGARTFLGTPEEVTRLSGRLRLGHSTASAMNTPESDRGDAGPGVAPTHRQRRPGKAGKRSIGPSGGAPCPGGGAHPSGRHPVFTRVVAHPCATCAPPPGHGVLGRRPGRSFSPLREPGSRRGMKRHDRSRDLEAPEDVAGRGGLREWPWMATPASRHRDVPSRRPQSPSGRRGSLRSQPRIAVALVVAVPVAVRLAVKRDRQRLSRPRRHPHHRAPCAARR